mmetsp:Transcript_21843/g.49385  ORF Transcript_21843/g.49385 Transcript_21843/m.49385 type:complete len:246 (+) Transcript_21843:50-787(+)
MVRLALAFALSPSSVWRSTALAKTSMASVVSVASDGSAYEADPAYPGTAVARMNNARARAKAANLTGEWEEVRRAILWAGGLKDLPNARPGQGYTGHSFNDWNHCDLTCMTGSVAGNQNEGRVEGIARSNLLGPGIALASLQDLGPGGSWSTCIMGCHKEPPQDVAHLQFRSRIAFKLVWCPPGFESFVLVDDDGAFLNAGAPTGKLPPLRERAQNFQAVKGGRYEKEAIAHGSLGTREEQSNLA